MERSFDPKLLREATEDFSFVSDEVIEPWLADHKNYMYAEGDSIGLATYEYPGLYSVHWFFTGAHRGRKAIDLAHSMLDALFHDTNAKAVRGLTKVELRGARWACRQLGLTSYGIMDFASGPCELFCTTREDFYKGKE
jgi:hypothetical protein